MSRLQRGMNVGAVILPFAAFAAAVPLLWNVVLITPERQRQRMAEAA